MFLSVVAVERRPAVTRGQLLHELSSRLMSTDCAHAALLASTLQLTVADWAVWKSVAVTQVKGLLSAVRSLLAAAAQLVTVFLLCCD